MLQYGRVMDLGLGLEGRRESPPRPPHTRVGPSECETDAEGDGAEGELGRAVFSILCVYMLLVAGRWLVVGERTR